MPRSGRSGILHTTHLAFTNTVFWAYHHPHFTDGETEAQSLVTCPRSYSLGMQPRFKLRSTDHTRKDPTSCKNKTKYKQDVDGSFGVLGTQRSLIFVYVLLIFPTINMYLFFVWKQIGIHICYPALICCANSGKYLISLKFKVLICKMGIICVIVRLNEDTLN